MLRAAAGEAVLEGPQGQPLSGLLQPAGCLWPGRPACALPPPQPMLSGGGLKAEGRATNSAPNSKPILYRLSCVLCGPTWTCAQSSVPSCFVVPEGPPVSE